MSFMMIARMGQFAPGLLELAEAPGKPFDPIAALGDRFATAAHYATVNWLVAKQLGVPSAPFEIELCHEPLRVDGDGDGWAMNGAVTLRVEDNFTLRLAAALRRIGVSDLFCVTASISASDPQTEIFAIDAALNEIPESRQSVTAPLGTAFFGPGIVGLRATGEATLEHLVAFGISGRHREFELLATVAPTLSGVAAYDQQFYLGKSGSADDMLQSRLRADGLARANGNLPASAVLEHYVHREGVQARAAQTLGLEPVAMLEREFAAILADPEWSYPSQYAPAGAEFLLSPASMLQPLALAGPVEATALGTSVTVPVPLPFPFLKDPQAVFDAVMLTRVLPIPLIRITSHHVEAGAPVVTQAYAGLNFCCSPCFTARASAARTPAGLDLKGRCDAIVSLDRPSRSLSFYPDLSDGGEQFPTDPPDPRPRAHLASGDSADDTVSGLPRFVVGPLALPLDSPVDQPLVLHGRDIFGRWPPPAYGRCSLDPLPVQAPKLYPPEIEYREHGKVSLKFRLSWDWSLRTPFDLRIAVATQTTDDIDPASGIHLPDFAAGAALSIRFDGDLPRLEGDQVPAGTEVAAVPLVLDTSAGAIPTDVRTYAVRIPMGIVADHFADNAMQSASVALDAWELVGGHTPERRSAPQHQSLQFADPRPPVLSGDSWALIWASRPDGGNVARGYFDLRKLSARPVAGFHAWRAHESALLDLAVTAMPGDATAHTAFIAGVLSTRDRQTRLAMIKGAVAPHLRKPTFRKAFVELFEVDRTTITPSEIELAVPGSQSGLEFVMFSAVSKAGVASDRLALSNLYAVAVPARSTLPTPTLRLLVPDDGSPLATAGCVLAVASAPTPFDASQLRFFWDDAEMTSSDELLHRLAPLSQIDAAEAERLVPGTNQALRKDPHASRHYYILQPPPRWGIQHFACALSRPAEGGAKGDLVSPRSMLASLHLVPGSGPSLVIDDVAIIQKTANWTLILQGIDGVTYDNLAPSQIQFDLVDNSDAAPTAEPQSFAEFLSKGAAIGPVSATAENPGVIHVLQPADLAGKLVRIAVSDPAGRFDVLLLPPAP